MKAPSPEPIRFFQDVEGRWHMTTWGGGSVPLARPGAVFLALQGHWRSRFGRK